MNIGGLSAAMLALLTGGMKPTKKDQDDGLRKRASKAEAKARRRNREARRERSRQRRQPKRKRRG